MRENNKTFSVRCNIGNQGTLSIEIPKRLYKEFEHKVQNNDLHLLCEIFEDFSKLQPSLRRLFQHRLLVNIDRINTLEDVLFLLWDTRVQ